MSMKMYYKVKFVEIELQASFSVQNTHFITHFPTLVLVHSRFAATPVFILPPNT